jgi:dihydrofolate reductase
MRKIVYYVASSIDGYISSVDEDISGFVDRSDGVEKYLSDLKNFDTTIMGRKTYEFGYKFGLIPGQPAYPHMQHYIFSGSLQFENQDERVHIKKIDLDEIKAIRNQPGTDIYLCGGGEFAGWLLDHAQIDNLKIKLNPLLLGEGVRLFGNSVKNFTLELLDTALYDQGLQIITYRIKY